MLQKARTQAQSEQDAEYERLRQQELLKYKVLDTEPEPCFDEIAHLASYICKAPIALVTFVDTDGNRIFFKSRLGLEAAQIPLSDKDTAFCAQSILTDTVMVVRDALADDRFKCNPLVTSEPKVRFYAGAPLVAPSGHRLGNLCVIDQEPRDLDSGQRLALAQLAKQVVSQLELRFSLFALRQKNEQLARLSEEKNQFLGAVSHDIRQPLTTIMVCSELMLHDDEAPLPAQQVELAGTAYSCAQFMHHLVDELLHMVEFDFGKVPVALECRLTDIVALVDRVVTTNALYARRKSISLRMGVLIGALSPLNPSPSGSFQARPGAVVDPTSGVATYADWERSHLPQHRINCYVDAAKFEQVLNNLISNAVKFSHPHNCVDIVVGTTRDGNDENSGDERKRWASVSVTDRGLGIPRNEMDKLFQPFKRVSVRPTGGETSTGLGLAIVRNIIAAHHGEVQVKSEEGKGSTFRVLLPLPTRADVINNARSLARGQQSPLTGGVRRREPGLHGAEAESKVAAAMSATGARSAALIGGNCFNVLVADDNAINLRLMTHILQRRGHTVWTASDGSEALDVFHGEGGHDTFHVLLLDEEMPRMRGVEAIERIRRHEAEQGPTSPRMALVSVSGHAHRDHEREIKAAGADDVCPKPFEVSKLIGVVERWGTEYLERLARARTCNQ